MIIGAGVIIGIIAVALVYFGNPANMGFCIACFLRDTTGALGFHSAAAVQYIRPEIVGLVLGSCILALATKEFKPRGGSAPVTRFVIGMFVMIGCLMFLGCPFRMILRLAGGDWNAIFGLIGFIVGILAGVFFLKKGYTLKRSYKMQPVEGVIFPVVEIGILVLLIAAPAFIHFTEADGGPGAKHAAIAISLIAGLVVGALAQRTRLCICCNSGKCPDRKYDSWIFPSWICRTGNRAHRWSVECTWNGTGWIWLRASWRLPTSSAGTGRRRKYRFRNYCIWTDGWRSCGS